MLKSKFVYTYYNLVLKYFNKYLINSQKYGHVFNFGK